MIKVGDKVKFKKYDETIYTVVNVEEKHVRVINSTGTQLMQVRKDIIDVVEQSMDYKQRADELEKRWSNLKSFIGLRNAQAIYECLDAEEMTNGILKYIDLLEDNND